MFFVFLTHPVQWLPELLSSLRFKKFLNLHSPGEIEISQKVYNLFLHILTCLLLKSIDKCQGHVILLLVGQVLKTDTYAYCSSQYCVCAFMTANFKSAAG